MRQIITTAALLLALTGCAGSSGVVTKPDATGTSKAAASATEPAALKLGQPATIKGNAEGVQAQVTAMKVAATTKSTDGFSTPEKGMRYMAVQFRIVNTGTAPYDDTPANGARVVDADGQQFNAALMVTKIAAGVTFPAGVKIPPKGSALGYLAFEVPEKAKIVKVQFGMESGFGQTAEWTL